MSYSSLSLVPFIPYIFLIFKARIITILAKVFPWPPFRNTLWYSFRPNFEKMRSNTGFVARGYLEGHGHACIIQRPIRAYFLWFAALPAIRYLGGEPPATWDEQIWDRWLIHSKMMFLDNQTVKFYSQNFRQLWYDVFFSDLIKVIQVKGMFTV